MARGATPIYFSSLFFWQLHFYFCRKNSAQGEILQNISLINDGNDTITIKKIDVSCGCISAMPESMIIPPHKNTILHIRLNLYNKNGYFNKVVFINSDADNCLELLRIKGDILE